MVTSHALRKEYIICRGAVLLYDSLEHESEVRVRRYARTLKEYLSVVTNKMKYIIFLTYL